MATIKERRAKAAAKRKAKGKRAFGGGDGKGKAIIRITNATAKFENALNSLSGSAISPKERERIKSSRSGRGQYD